MNKFCNIVVIGSGVMGAGIAAQIANAGFKVHLLDIVPDGASDNNILANNAIIKLKKSNAIADNNLIDKIISGNLNDDLNILKSADFIIEAIIENLEIKSSLYKKLEKHCKSDCMVSSNTSTIPLNQLIKEMSDNFKQNFLITHFFNPPRFMPLLELITSKYTKTEVIASVTEFMDINLGRYIVKCNDTPGFIANRIGCYWLMVALDEAINNNLTIEDIDYLIGEIIGIPKTAIFGLYDLIGIDVMQLIGKSLSLNLNLQDEFVEVSNNISPLLEKMINTGLLGRKTKSGFYRINKNENGEKITEVIDLKTLEYRLFKPSKLHYQNIRELIDNNRNALNILSKTLCYAAKLIPEISEDISAVDQAMKLGYNWKYGPFELIDLIGTDYFKQKLIQQHINVPKIINLVAGKSLYQKENYFSFNGYKPITRARGITYLKDFYSSTPILKNDKCSIWNIENNVAIIELTNKMGILHQDIFHLIKIFLEQYSSNFQSIIIANNQSNFSVGGDLRFMLAMAQEKNWQAIDDYLKLGQETMLMIKYSSAPIIAAVKGMALGGGSELLLHSKAVTAHIDTNSGLVEAGVGLIPAWGGSKEMILRSQSIEELNNAFKYIVSGDILDSAYDLQKTLQLTEVSIIMNKDRVLGEAIKKSPSSVKFISKKEKLKFNLDYIELKLIGYDQVIAKELAEIFKMNNASEQDLLEQERAIFIKLLHNTATQERIAYTLSTGKRLKN